MSNISDISGSPCIPSKIEPQMIEICQTNSWKERLACPALNPHIWQIGRRYVREREILWGEINLPPTKRDRSNHFSDSASTPPTFNCCQNSLRFYKIFLNLIVILRFVLNIMLQFFFDGFLKKRVNVCRDKILIWRRLAPLIWFY